MTQLAGWEQIHLKVNSTLEMHRSWRLWRVEDFPFDCSSESEYFIRSKRILHTV